MVTSSIGKYASTLPEQDDSSDEAAVPSSRRPSERNEGHDEGGADEVPWGDERLLIP